MVQTVTSDLLSCPIHFWELWERTGGMVGGWRRAIRLWITLLYAWQLYKSSAAAGLCIENRNDWLLVASLLQQHYLSWNAQLKWFINPTHNIL